MTIPHDSTAEAGALACVLSANGDAGRLLKRLQPEYFYELRHKTIFGNLVGLAEDGAPIDAVGLYDRLNFLEELSDAGGIEYISTLPEKTLSGAQFDSYLNIIRDRAARREAIEKADREKLRALDPSIPFVEIQKSNWETRLQERAFNFHQPPPDLVPVFSLCGGPVCTAGNITSIVAQAKAGKSAVIGAMQAATFSKDQSADLLGFESQNPSGLAVIHFDTEQSPHDAWHVVARAVRRSGASEPPPWLLSYCLTGLLPKEAWQAVQEGVRLAAEKFNGVHSVLIDGVGDLVHDVNDAGECTDFVALLHGLAITHNCPVIGVLHFNPDSANARGHLGSQLERKSESNLRLDKEEDCTILWSNKQRRASIARDFGPRFKWDDEAGMHMTIESRSESRRSAKAEAMIPGRDDVFYGRQGMRWNEMLAAIETTDKCVRRTAERRVADWKKLGLIEQSVAGLWVPKG